MALRCCFLYLIKQNIFAEIFFKNSNLDDWGISVPAFPSRANLKLHNISITPKLNKMIGPDCISVIILKECGPEIIPAEFFNVS